MIVGVVCKPELKNLNKIHKLITEYFKDKNCKIIYDKNFKIKKNKFTSQINLIKSSNIVLAFGGDGTLLHIAKDAAKFQKPVIGFNVGNLGFLTEAPLSKFKTVMNKYFKDDLRSDKRNLLVANLESKEKKVKNKSFLNDLVINKGALSKIIDLNVFVDGKPVSQIRADGLILSTPTGSTAYSLSAGGPIVVPSLPLMIITPICPHTLSNRPLVISEKCEVSIRVNSDNHVFASFDGANNEKLNGKTTISVKKSSLTLNLLRMKNTEYFSVLKDKLMWSNLYEHK